VQTNKKFVSISPMQSSEGLVMSSSKCQKMQ